MELWLGRKLREYPNAVFEQFSDKARIHKNLLPYGLRIRRCRVVRLGQESSPGPQSSDGVNGESYIRIIELNLPSAAADRL